MDAATADFYSSDAHDIVQRYESVPSRVARYFGTAFATGSRVLDMDAGSGRRPRRVFWGMARMAQNPYKLVKRSPFYNTAPGNCPHSEVLPETFRKQLPFVWGSNSESQTLAMPKPAARAHGDRMRRCTVTPRAPRLFLAF